MATSTQRLRGRRAVVTGAGSGIGEATAIGLAREGARVGLIGRRQHPLEDVARKIIAGGGDALVLSCDVSKEDDVRRSFAATEARWGGVDLCVASAGIELWQEGDDRVDRIELATWQRMIDINLTGMFLTLKYAVRAMLTAGGGSIVVIGSPTGLYGEALDQNAYSATKAGCHGLARAVANGVARDNIRVNIVVPGFIETPINATRLIVDAVGVEEFRQKIPLRRLGRVEEVAAMNVWLCSDESSYCTGSYFAVDGGEMSI
jgi:3-oxoacyl-[acyl-carrier protein] reductase